jgi:hypothetical protein
VSSQSQPHDVVEATCLQKIRACLPVLWRAGVGPGLGTQPCYSKRSFVCTCQKTEVDVGRSGTGLGMAVVWNTLKAHKEYLDEASLEGEGMIFSLYFLIASKQISKFEIILKLAFYQNFFDLLYL